MSRETKHDRANAEVQLFIIGGLATLSIVGFAVIQSWMETLWMNPDQGVNTITNFTNSLGSTVSSMGSGMLFIVVIGFVLISYLLE